MLRCFCHQFVQDIQCERVFFLGKFLKPVERSEYVKLPRGVLCITFPLSVKKTRRVKIPFRRQMLHDAKDLVIGLPIKFFFIVRAMNMGRPEILVAKKIFAEVDDIGMHPADDVVLQLAAFRIIALIALEMLLHTFRQRHDATIPP